MWDRTIVLAKSGRSGLREYTLCSISLVSGLAAQIGI